MNTANRFSRDSVQPLAPAPDKLGSRVGIVVAGGISRSRTG